jgi:hypothetical protein
MHARTHPQARQLLVTVGLEEPGISTATIKVWDAERAAAAAAAAAANTAVGAASSSVTPLRVHKVFSSKFPESEVTALAVCDSGASAPGPAASGSSGSHLRHSSGSLSAAAAAAGAGGGDAAGTLTIAVGLAAGAVYLFGGDAATPKGKLHHTGKLQARPDAGELWRVTALAFTQQQQQQQQQQQGMGSGSGSGAKQRQAGAPAAKQQQQQQQRGGSADAASSSSSSPWLYVTTESQTLAFHMGDLSRTILDQQGLATGPCAALRDGLLLVARDDALYEYTTDTRAGCTAFDGTCVRWRPWFAQQRSRLPPLHGQPAAAAADATPHTPHPSTQRTTPGVKQALGLLQRYLYVVTDDTSADGAATSQLQVLDVKNKLVAGACAPRTHDPPGVSGVLSVVCMVARRVPAPAVRDSVC